MTSNANEKSEAFRVCLYSQRQKPYGAEAMLDECCRKGGVIYGNF